MLLPLYGECSLPLHIVGGAAECVFKWFAAMKMALNNSRKWTLKIRRRNKRYLFTSLQVCRRRRYSPVNKKQFNIQIGEKEREKTEKRWNTSENRSTNFSLSHCIRWASQWCPHLGTKKHARLKGLIWQTCACKIWLHCVKIPLLGHCYALI